MRKCYTNEAEAQYRMTTVQGSDSEVEQEKVGYVQVLTDPMYKKASQVGAIMMFFSQLSGINAIMQYSG